MVDQIGIIRVLEIRKNDDDSEEGEEKHVTNLPNYCYMLHLVTIIGVTTVSLVPQTLIPRHNSIYYPNYWYENAIAVAFVGSTILSMRTMLECFTFTKEKSIVTMNVGLKMYEHPMPFLGLFVFFSLWFQFICLSGEFVVRIFYM